MGRQAETEMQAAKVLDAALETDSIVAYDHIHVRVVAALLRHEAPRAALLDALGHSPDCVAPDHYRKVWQEERDRAERAKRAWEDAENRVERAEALLRDALAALSADADADAEPYSAHVVTGTYDPEPSRAEGDEPNPFRCQRCTVPIAYTGAYGDMETHVAPGLDPSRNREAVEANADHDPLPETRDAEGGRPREADPQGDSPSTGASVDGGGDDGRSESEACRYVRHHLDRAVRHVMSNPEARQFAAMVDCVLIERSLGWREVDKQGARADRAEARVRELEETVRFVAHFDPNQVGTPVALKRIQEAARAALERDRRA